MPTATLPSKVLELNKAMAERAIATTASIARTVGRNALTVIEASRTAGKTVVGQSRAVVERTVKTARNGAREVNGQVEAQGARLGKVVSTQANRTVNAAARAIDDKPSGRPYEQWTKAQLMERAQELDIDGRASMSKPQLIKALRKESGPRISFMSRRQHPHGAPGAT